MCVHVCVLMYTQTCLHGLHYMHTSHQYLNSGHCSALVKALPGYEDVFASHSRYCLQYEVCVVWHEGCGTRGVGYSMRGVARGVEI